MMHAFRRAVRLHWSFQSILGIYLQCLIYLKVLLCYFSRFSKPYSHRTISVPGSPLSASLFFHLSGNLTLFYSLSPFSLFHPHCRTYLPASTSTPTLLPITIFITFSIPAFTLSLKECTLMEWWRAVSKTSGQGLFWLSIAKDIKKRPVKQE